MFQSGRLTIEENGKTLDFVSSIDYHDACTYFHDWQFENPESKAHAFFSPHTIEIV